MIVRCFVPALVAALLCYWIGYAVGYRGPRKRLERMLAKAGSDFAGKL